MVSRSTSDKKTFFVVKAGPFDSKKLAEETGRRLKSEERLPHAPKVVKITAAAPKTALKKASP